MEQEIREYMRILQCIAISKGGDIYAPTLPAYNARRMDIHQRLFEKIMQGLTLVDGFTEDDAFWRSKEIFSRLDKVFRLYNDFDLNLEDSEHIAILSKDLMRFLSSIEVKYYLEGRISGIHGVIENED